MYQSINQSTKFAYRPYKTWTAVLNNVNYNRGYNKNIKSKIKTDDRERES